MDVTRAVTGGGFLITAAGPRDVFTPEDFSTEHRLAARSLTDFLEAEVEPRTAELETHNYPLMRRLLVKLGGLGFLGVDVPEAYGGSDLDFITSLLVSETMSRGSFAVSFGAHTGIGTLPIVYFGNEAQKRRYLPGLASGETVGAYALTEPTAGSDALGARTRAVLAEDGQAYRLTGTKQFITNAGFADLFTTYAKVDGERFTGFIVERKFEGLEIGPEEHKMGIKGSSTASVFFDSARVPAENVLGEVGAGHRVALNILNIGRLKLAVACAGASKRALRQAIAYAMERRQFGRPIASFGLIQQKLAEMAVRIYLLESMIYRTGGLIEAARASGPVVRAVEEYAVECAVDKVYASEAADFVMDELVQIYGGSGFIEEYPAARQYRDSRISRIYEGTNEINRLLITGMLLRRAQRGRLPLLEACRTAAETRSLPAPPQGARDGGPLTDLRDQIERAKHACLLVTGLAVERHGDGIGDQQEVLAAVADTIIETFAMESGLLRALRTPHEGRDDLVRAGTAAGIARVHGSCRRVLASLLDGEALRTRLDAVRRLLDGMPPDTFHLGRRIAARLLEAGSYVA
ncbi:MAG TPA: acyl-CoA dehydrogenase family protein [bacterium]|nr:acyl-CoA dehydrogenase family protein [bacterium]